METDFSSLDDESLLKWIREGNSESFDALVVRHASRFYSVAYRFVQNAQEAEDVVQTAFLKLWEKPEQWDPSRKVRFTTWFYRVVINLCLDWGKKRRPVPLTDPDTVDGRPDPEASAIRREQQAHLVRLIRGLPDRQRTALILCFYEGLSNREAAEIMGVDVKAVQSLIMRAKSGLRDRLRPAGIRI